MKKILMFILISFPVLLFAQKKNKTAEKYANTISATDLKERLYIVASEENAGRDTPSPGLEKAAAYIETSFQSFGLQPGNGTGYRLSYPLYRDSMISTGMKINGKEYELNKDFQPQSSINYSASMAFSEAVFVGYGIVEGERDDYKSADVHGKLVLILDGTPEGYKSSQQGFRSPSGFFGKMNTAAKKGAAAVIVITANYPRPSMNERVQWNLNGYTPSVSPLIFTASQDVASAIMGDEGKDILSAMKKEDGLPLKTYPVSINLSYWKTTTTGYAADILGTIEGTDKKDEWVIVTAHYDHVGTRNGKIYYGADDDGSGTVSVLEIARAFAKAKAEGKGPRRSMLFMTVSGEEHGLWGSAYYANHPVYPLDKTSADLNIDMIGRVGSEYQNSKDSSNYVYIIGDDKLSSDLNPITEQVNKTYAKMILDRKYNDPKDPNRFYYRSDHFNFAEKGVPVIFYFNGTHKDYHQPTDTPDKINYSLMEKRARLVFYTAWEIANRDDMLKRDIPLTK